MELKFRHCDMEDSKEVFEFFQDLKEEEAQVGFTDVESVLEINNWLTDPRTYLFLAVDGTSQKIVGVFRANRGKDYKKHSAFITAAVDASYRGRGVAKALANHALEELKKEGILVARTYVYSDNHRSLNVLLSCGFTIAGAVVMHHYSEKDRQYVDDIILHKIL